MALVLAEDSVKETTSTTGIDVLLLSGAVSGFSTFAAGIGANNTTYYTIEDANGNFEIGVGTVRTSPDRLERNIVLASSTGSKLALSSGTHTVESGYASNRDTFLETIKYTACSPKSIYVPYDVFASREVNASTGTFSNNINTPLLDMTPISEADYPTHQEGLVFYDNENKALTVYNDEADVSLQVGQEQYIRVRNNTGSTINNGQAVRIAGAHGNAAPTIALASADTEDNSTVAGIATHSIEDNSFGYITSFGIVRNLNTNSFNGGDELFLSTSAGGLVNVAPLAPNFSSAIGYVISKHPTNGTILVALGKHKLGGGDLNSSAKVYHSGIPFVKDVSDTTSGGMVTSPEFVYASGLQQLRLGVGGLVLDNVNVSGVQTSAESFVDSDLVIMTAAAIEDRYSSSGGAGTMNTVKRNNVQVGGSDIVTLNFSSDFGVAEDPDTEIDITIGTLNQNTTGSAGSFSSAVTITLSGDVTGSANFTSAGDTATISTTIADAGLTSIAGLTTAANKMIYTTALDTYAVADLTAAARTLLDDATVGDMRTTLGVAIGSDVQAYDAGLNSIAGLTTAANKMIYTTNSDTYAVADLTATARTLLDDATVGDMRTTLGVYASTTTLNNITTPDGDLSLNSNKITNLTDPTGDQDAATKSYVDAIKSGLDVKDSCHVATTTAGTLSTSFANGQTVDGVTLVTGDRILIKDQATGSENGIYTVNSSGAPTRATDFDSNAEVTSGAFTFVEEGTVNGDGGFVLTTNDPITVGTTSLTFVQFSGAGQITAGTGLSKSGNTLNVNIGSDVQAYDAGLTSIAGLTTAANKMIYTSASDTYAVTDLTAAARTVLDDSTVSDMRTTLGVAIGSDVQAYDADLTAIATLSSADGNFIVGSAGGWVVESGATARTSLGVDPAGTDNSTNVTLAGSLDYITISGQEITRNAIDLAADVTGTLPATNGGTGLTSISTLLNSNTTSSDVGLGNVENTALSTWPGTSNITTVGALDAGSITSGFGNIDNGSSSIACGSLDISDGNITNVGDIDCDSISVDDAASGLNVDFSGANTGTGKITLKDNVASALDIITSGPDSYMKFNTETAGTEVTYSKEAVEISKPLKCTQAIHSSISKTNAISTGQTLKGGGTGNVVTLDLASAGFFRVQLTANVDEIWFKNQSEGQKVIIRFEQDGTGSRTVDFSAFYAYDGTAVGVNFAGGTAPTLTTTASKADIIGFLNFGIPAGSVHYYNAVVIGQDFS